MANRNRDTMIWRDPFYRTLPPLYKCFWDYINDDCDNAGVWLVDFKVASICVGRKVRPEIALELFGDRVQVFAAGTKWHIKTFISEKLGFADLSPSQKFQKSIIDLLDKHGIEKNKGYTDPLERVIRREEQGKGKDKDKSKDNTTTKLTYSGNGVEKFSDEWFAQIFDELTLEQFMMNHRGKDVHASLANFKMKVRMAKDNYQAHDTPGMRLAFNHHLQNTRAQKPKFKDLKA